jgi:hypothetical protein
MIGSHTADAQLVNAPVSPSIGQGIEVLATPYLWLPWSSIRVRPGDTRFAAKSTTIDPGDLYSHLTWFPFMGEAEFRSGQFGLIVDYIHAPLKAGVSTRNILFNGATSGLTTGSAQPSPLVAAKAGNRPSFKLIEPSNPPPRTPIPTCAYWIAAPPHGH